MTEEKLSAKELAKMIAINKLHGEPEIFESIQGEGRFLGVEVTFVRLKGCVLACSWCDTRDAWDPNFHLNEGVCRMTIEELGDRLLSNKPQHAVITGGEPMIQQVKLVKLIDYVKERNPDYKFDIETCGAIVPNKFIQERMDHWNISPKLENSHNDLRKRRNPKALQTLASMPNSDFKFVVSCLEDVAEIKEIVELAGMPSDRVFLMPLGTTVEELDKNEVYIDELVKETGYTKSTREHIRLFGNKRGV